jgi:hemerythrin superfamily protein
MTATDLLKKDHAAVKKLFAQFAKAGERAVKRRETLIETIAHELQVHSKIEEEIFYPAIRKVEGGAEMVEEALREHEEVDRLLSEIRGMDVEGEPIVERLSELKEAVLDHATEEERAMFKKARELGSEELERLGEQLHERKQALVSEMKPARKRAGKRGVRRAA